MKSSKTTHASIQASAIQPTKTVISAVETLSLNIYESSIISYRTVLLKS
jgi:hypothetical protein